MDIKKLAIKYLLSCIFIINLLSIVTLSTAQAQTYTITAPVDGDWSIPQTATKGENVILKYTGNGYVNSIKVKIKQLNNCVSGIFSVSDTKTVFFSHGNLQFNTSSHTWRLAPTQYDFCHQNSDNLGVNYSQWILHQGWTDLFSWGMWIDDYKTDLDIMLNTESTEQYFKSIAISDETNDFINNKTTLNGYIWQTLNADEWQYLLSRGEDDGNIKYGYGVIQNGSIKYYGLIVLPDIWNDPKPNDKEFKNGDIRKINRTFAWEEANNYTLEEWSIMEKSGVLFLPAAGHRFGKRIEAVGIGYYWTSSRKDNDDQRRCNIDFFLSKKVNYSTNGPGYIGASARLVQPQTIVPIQQLDGTWVFPMPDSDVAIEAELLDISINPLTVSEYKYDGTEKKPVVSAEVGIGSSAITIEPSKCKAVYPDDVINAGTKNITEVKVWNNGGGEASVHTSLSYQITPIVIDPNDPAISSLMQISLNPDSYIYDGKAKEPAVTITYKGTEIPAAEYTVTYQDNINVGTAKAIISDNQGGNYTISGEAPFTINLLVIDPTDPNLSIIIETTTYEYTGAPIEPKVTVTYNGITVPSTEYTVTYQNNTNVGTATIIITDNPNGNYTINGETQFTIKPGKISITPVNIDADGYILADASNQYFCSGKAVIEFTVSKGNPQNYSIEFDGGDIPSPSGAISGNSVEIELPKDLLPGTYSGTIELTSTDGNSTDKLPIKVIVKLPYYTIVPLYNDVVAVNQLAGEFSSYKWTENGSEISGVNGRILQHTFNKSAVYTAILTKSDGSIYETCPLDLSRFTVANSTAKLIVYPNPATSGNDITVEVSENYNPEAKKQIYIYNINGTLVKRLSSPQEINKIQLPNGNYSGLYIQNGEKVPFKVIVK